MIDINKKEDCCGCHGCKSICPKGCIRMKNDEEGFWYPKIDKSICIDCNLCEKVCPMDKNKIGEKKDIIAYACKNKDNEIRINSSSGGVFSLLCEMVISNGGVVFGAAYNEKLEVCHSYSESIDGCIKFRGSKYVQSRIGDMYIKVKEFLQAGRIVLFSGTPCQVSGLECYLMKKYRNLILVDIACHGVPSPLVFKKYINQIENDRRNKVTDIQFRDKSTGWKSYSLNISLKEERIFEKGYDNVYMKGFLGDLYLRPSCYECEFKKPITSADITLADYWGVQHIHDEFDDDKGVSLILANTDVGKEVLKTLKDKLEIINTNLEFALKYNPSIINHAKYNKKRKVFFSEINSERNNLIKSINKYTKDSLKYRVKIYLRKIKKKLT